MLLENFVSFLGELNVFIAKHRELIDNCNREASFIMKGIGTKNNARSITKRSSDKQINREIPCQIHYQIQKDANSLSNCHISYKHITSFEIER